MQHAHSERLLTLPFVLAFAASFLTGLAHHGFLHLPGYVQELGASELEIGLVMGTMSATGVAARPFLGRLMDTRGRRPVLVAGAVLTLVACLLYLTVRQIGPWIYVVRMVHGVATAAMFSVLFTIAADIVPATRMTEGIALFGVSGMLPLAVGGLLGDFVLARGDYQDLFLVTAVIAGLAMVMVAPIRDSRPSPGEHDEPARSYLAAIADAPLRPLWLVGIGFALSVASYFSFLKTFVIDRGVGSVGLFFSAYALTAVALRVLFAWLPDRVGPKRMLFPSLACGAAGAVALAYAQSGTAVAVAGVLCGAGHGYAFPIVSGLVVARARPSERGAAISMFTALFDFGLLIGSPLLGAVVELGSYQAMYLTAAVLVLVSTVVFAVWDRGR